MKLLAIPTRILASVACPLSNHIAAGLRVAMLALTMESIAHAGTIIEGFEGSSYNLATQGGGTAAIVKSPVHSGSQSLQLSLSTSSDYARVKLDTSAYGLKLGQITAADYWVDRTQGAPSLQLPYIIFSITTPSSGGNDNTLAVMYNNPSTTSGWTDLTVGPTTLFHMVGDTTGLVSPDAITLAGLQNSTYSPGMSWGSFAVDFVRIGYGLAGPDGVASTSFVDDLTISAVPEPASLVLLGLGGLSLWAVARRRRKA